MFGNLGGFSDFFNTLFGQGGFGARPAYGAGSRSAQTARPMEHEVELTSKKPTPVRSACCSLRTAERSKPAFPPGVRTGSKVRLSGQAGGADLFLKIKVLPHKRFTRKGDDLITTVSVDIYTAILGEVMWKRWANPSA